MYGPGFVRPHRVNDPVNVNPAYSQVGPLTNSAHAQRFRIKKHQQKTQALRVLIRQMTVGISLLRGRSSVGFRAMHAPIFYISISL